MQRIGVEIDLGTLKCHDEADKAGNSEPYMWTVFFKIDGTTCVLTGDLFLAGTATIKTSPGNHGNLVGGGGMDAGDVVDIPSALGHWKTGMVPITSVESKKLKVGGVLGCVVVVLEEDETPHAAAAAGHQAFNQTMQRELDALIPTFGIEKSSPTAEDIQALSDTVSSAVYNAIESKVGAGEFIAGWFGGGQDDKIGRFTGIWSHDLIEDTIGHTPLDIYDKSHPLEPLFGGYPLSDEDGVYSLRGGTITAKRLKLKLGGTSTPPAKKPNDPDNDGWEPHKPDIPGKKGPNPPN